MPAKKITIILPQTRPRNPLLVPGLTRHAGPHGKTRKAMRQQLRQRTQQSLADLINGDKAEFEIDYPPPPERAEIFPRRNTMKSTTKSTTAIASSTLSHPTRSLEFRYSHHGPAEHRRNHFLS